MAMLKLSSTRSPWNSGLITLSLFDLKIHENVCWKFATFYIFQVNFGSIMAADMEAIDEIEPVIVQEVKQLINFYPNNIQ